MSFTIVGAPIAQFVRDAIEERNGKLAEREDINISVDPEILSVIHRSTAVATQVGTSAHLLKVGSKRRRTKAEI